MSSGFTQSSRPIAKTLDRRGIGLNPILQSGRRKLCPRDCETTTEELGQKFNFGFYRECATVDGEFVTSEEGIIVADDLEEREGQKAVELLHRFARTHKADTICGRFAKIRVYSRSEFMEKVFFPWAVLRKAVIVGANLPFDLSVLSVRYHEHKTENGFSSELAARYRGRENKRYPRLRDVAKN